MAVVVLLLLLLLMTDDEAGVPKTTSAHARRSAQARSR
eukprot:COSAG01_NODE_5643_length_4121_cov_2.779960_9_plen_37_part_01